MKMSLKIAAAVLISAAASTSFAAQVPPRTICDSVVSDLATAIGKSKGAPNVYNWIVSSNAADELTFDVALVNNKGFSRTTRVVINAKIQRGFCNVQNLQVVF
jgi:hypothetical protein